MSCYCLYAQENEPFASHATKYSFVISNYALSDHPSIHQISRPQTPRTCKCSLRSSSRLRHTCRIQAASFRKLRIRRRPPRQSIRDIRTIATSRAACIIQNPSRIEHTRVIQSCSHIICLRLRLGRWDSRVAGRQLHRLVEASSQAVAGGCSSHTVLDHAVDLFVGAGLHLGAVRVAGVEARVVLHQAGVEDGGGAGGAGGAHADTAF